MGIQVPGSERRAFDEVLAKINYRYREETHNPAYRQYLGNLEIDRENLP